MDNKPFIELRDGTIIYGVQVFSDGCGKVGVRHVDGSEDWYPKEDVKRMHKTRASIAEDWATLVRATMDADVGVG